MAALSIVFGKYLAFNIGETFRVSLENLPIIMTSITLGPLWGAAVGLVADLVGCLMVGYTVNPLITLGAVSVGLVSGMVYRLMPRAWTWRKFAAVLSAHIVGSVLIKTAGLSLFYGTDYLTLVLYRVINYSLIIAMEYIIIYILTKNRGVVAILESLGGGEKI